MVSLRREFNRIDTCIWSAIPLSVDVRNLTYRSIEVSSRLFIIREQLIFIPRNLFHYEEN